MAVCWQVELCHYYCLPVKRVSKAGSFSLPGLPSRALPRLPHHNLQRWWWRYFTLLAENSSLAELTMQSNLHALKKILAFWTASRRCVPQLCRFDELVQFLQSIWRFTPRLGTPDLLRSIPWQAFHCGFLIYHENFCPLWWQLKARHCYLFCLSCFVRDWTLRDMVSWDTEFCCHHSFCSVSFSSSLKHGPV